MLKRDPEDHVVDARVAQHLAQLGARGPDLAEEQALRALARGLASPGQQKLALRYALELGGAAALVFEPASDRLTTFRLGSQALAQTLATVAGGAWVSFRAAEAEESEHDD